MAHVLHNISVDDLVRLTPDQIGTWLELIWTGKEPEPDNFNWVGLVEVLASNTHRAESPRLGLEWAHLAVSVYEYMIKTVDANYRNALRISQMRVRVNMIKTLGIVPGDSVLDPEYVKRWFFQELEFSFEETTELAAHWQELDVNRIRQLRGLKNRISVLRSLYHDTDKLKPDGEALRWINIWPSLP